MRHLLSIDDLDRDDIERILDRAAASPRSPSARSRRSRRCAAARVLNLFYEASHAHPLVFELAAKRLSRRRRQLRVARLGGREGRVAQGHRPDALGLRARRDRRPHAARRRRRAGRQLDDAARRQRRRRQARAPDPGAARPLHAARRALGPLDGAERSGSSATSCTRRVARSNILAFTRMGAHVTVCGPPTLIPRGIEALGCEVALHARRARRGRRRLRAADAARAHDRAPSCPRCASTPRATRSTAAGCGRQPGADAPRPGQPRRRDLRRGGRLAAGADHQQVEAGVVVRMAVLYELLAGRATRRPTRGRATRAAAGPQRLSSTIAPTPDPPTLLDPRRPCARPARRASTPPHDVLVRGGEIAEIGAPGSLEAPDGRRGGRRRGPAPASRLRRPARAPAHARAGGQGGPRDRHPRGRRGRLLRDRRDAEHRPGGRLGAGPALAARARAARGARPGRLPGRDHARARAARS